LTGRTSRVLAQSHRGSLQAIARGLVGQPGGIGRNRSRGPGSAVATQSEPREIPPVAGRGWRAKPGSKHMARRDSCRGRSPRPSSAHRARCGLSECSYRKRRDSGSHGALLWEVISICIGARAELPAERRQPRCPPWARGLLRREEVRQAWFRGVWVISPELTPSTPASSRCTIPWGNPL